jgi:hypothetical protein
MSTTANAILLNAAGHRVALDLDDETQLLPSFQANDRTKPDTIQSDYSPEFSVPATAKNHRLLGHAAVSQPVPGAAYKRVPAVLTSGGVETLPLATLLIKGYSEGRYNLQLVGGNRRLVEALGDKKLSDLDLSRFDHNWTPANILAGLPHAYWQANGWGYEFYDRGKPVDFQNTGPYSLYPSCSADLVLRQIVADAGFTADSLLAEPLFAQLNVPSANPFTFDSDYREARNLKSGFRHTGNWYKGAEFAPEPVPNNYTSAKPYALGAVAAAQGSTANRYVVTTLGFYDIEYSAHVYFGCNELLSGEVSMKFFPELNGSAMYEANGDQVKAEERVGKFTDTTLSFSKKRVLLHPGDVVVVKVQGDEWPSRGLGPYDQQWYIGTRTINPAPPFSGVEPAVSFSVTLNEEFPPGGLVKLNEWLPDMKQLDFVKAMMLVLGLTIQVDQYTPHLRFAPGWKLLANARRAKDWTMKRDAWAVPGRTPERDLAFRFGDYGQLNHLKWKEDENVTAGYGDGSLTVADEVLPDEYEMATLPFAATEASQQVPSLLRILNFDTDDATASPVVYSSVKAEPRLTLRPPAPDLSGQLIMQPATDTTAAVLAGFTTTVSYFDGSPLSLMLNKTVLTTYWPDLRAMLDQSRYLTERYRLTAQDVAELDFSVPIWDGLLSDYFAVSQISEFDARRPTEVKLCRLNAAHLGPPPVPPVLPGGQLKEWWGKEWIASEWY